MPALKYAASLAVLALATTPLAAKTPEEVAAETHTLVLAGAAERAEGELYRSVSVVENGRLLATYRVAALSDEDRAAGFRPGSDSSPIVSTERAGIIGLLGGREGLQPGAASALRRNGAQLLAWSAGSAQRGLLHIAQTRAWEQRLPVIAAGGASNGACVAVEGGTLAATTRPGTPMLTHDSTPLTNSPFSFMSRPAA